MADRYEDELHRLKSVEAEYRITVRVVAVLAELLLAGNPYLSEIRVNDAALYDSPEMVAWRDEKNHQTVITIKENS
jgi:hypothetical protein